ncbi:MAG: hypothetical protein JSS51_10180, partial [Planctomycetes bacterium]|nr:hypothetical protein [Planctomycetota bacterium]
MVATASIVIELGQGERHQAASLEGLREVFLTLARQARDARAEYVASPVRARMVESRMRLGSALIQLRPQVGHGHWRAFLNTLGEAANVSRHTLYRSVRMAAALATKTGDIDPAKVRAAREAIAAVANRKNGSNVARAQHFTGMGEADSNVARAQHFTGMGEADSNVARAQH